MDDYLVSLIIHVATMDPVSPRPGNKRLAWTLPFDRSRTPHRQRFCEKSPRYLRVG